MLSCALGVIAFMNAALGVRFAAFLALFFAPDFAAFLAPPFFAAPFFAEDFLAPPFFAAPFFALFFAAMLFFWDGEQVLTLRETLYDGAQDTIHSRARNREFVSFSLCVRGDFPLCAAVRACIARPDHSICASQSASAPSMSRRTVFV